MSLQKIFRLNYAHITCYVSTKSPIVHSMLSVDQVGTPSWQAEDRTPHGVTQSINSGDFQFLGKSNLWISMYGLSFLIKHTVLCVVPLRARGLDVAVSLPQYFKENGYMTLGMLYIDTQLWVHCDKREVVKASFQKTNVQPKEWERCFTLGCQTRQREMTIQRLGMRRSWIGN